MKTAYMTIAMLFACLISFAQEETNFRSLNNKNPELGRLGEFQGYNNDSFSILVSGNSLILNSNSVQGFNVKMFSLNGSLVAQTSLTDKTAVIDISNFPKGVYIVSIDTQGTIVTRKISIL